MLTHPQKNLGKKGGCRGFTLLEISITICIIVLILGMTLPAIQGVFGEHVLRSPAVQLQLFAKTARREAVEKRQPYHLILSKSSYRLVSFETEASTGKSKEVTHLHYDIPHQVDFLIQHWDSKEFIRPKDEAWIFQPTGILEPLHVRFQTDGSWIEFKFNPLTAGIEEEFFQFKG